MAPKSSGSFAIFAAAIRRASFCWHAADRPALCRRGPLRLERVSHSRSTFDVASALRWQPDRLDRFRQSRCQRRYSADGGAMSAKAERRLQFCQTRCHRFGLVHLSEPRERRHPDDKRLRKSKAKCFCRFFIQHNFKLVGCSTGRLAEFALVSAPESSQNCYVCWHHGGLTNDLDHPTCVSH